MSVRALWLPYEVADVAASTRFYTDHLGLSVVDGWDSGGESGVVLRVAGAAYLELASPGTGAPAPVAFELADRAAVDAAHQRLAGTPPRRFPRGHYGFDAPSPLGRVMVWSER
jgi:catechol 2,3-dioxygenase-like lactoylglutathione lyase family enzyme